MRQEEFQKIFTETVETCNKLLNGKGQEYAGSHDRLGNFKRGADRAGLTPLQVLWVYAAKHIDAIETYVRDEAQGVDRVRTEPIEGRLDDLINYCILAKAIIQSERRELGEAVARNRREEDHANTNPVYGRGLSEYSSGLLRGSGYDAGSPSPLWPQGHPPR